MRIILTVGDKVTIHEIPVYKECPLQTIHTTARYLQHSISPGLALRAFHITQGDIHASNEPCTSINDNHLPVVTIVHLTRKRREPHWQERSHLDTFLSHALKETVTHIPAPHIIVYQSYLYSLTSLGNKSITHHVSQGIVFEDIHIQMNMILCRGYLFQQSMKEAVSVSMYLYLAVFERQREVLTDKEVDDRFIFLWQMQVALFYELQHRTFGEHVETSLADEPLLTCVYPKEKIEHYSHHRHEPYHQGPCHRLCRLAVVEHHMDNREDDDHLINTKQYHLPVHPAIPLRHFPTVLQGHCAAPAYP